MINSFNNVKFIKYPILTEKTIWLLGHKRYTFIVDRYSDKNTIKKTIESLFNVKVIKINTCLLPRKKKQVGKFIGWKSKYKKAIVTLSKNSVINLFEDN